MLYTLFSFIANCFLFVAAAIGTVVICIFLLAIPDPLGPILFILAVCLAIGSAFSGLAGLFMNRSEQRT